MKYSKVNDKCNLRMGKVIPVNYYKGKYKKNIYLPVPSSYVIILFAALKFRTH